MVAFRAADYRAERSDSIFFSYWHALVDLSFSSSYHFERLFVIHSGADDLF